MIIPNGFGQVNYILGGSALPGLAEVTFGFDNNAGGPDPSVIAEYFKDAWVTNIKGITSSHLALVETKVKLGPNSTGAQGSFLSNEAGGVGGNTAPPQVASLIRKITASGGRHNRGRIYYPVVPEADVDDAGVLASSYISGLSTAWGDLVVQMAADDVQMVILHNDATAPTGVVDMICQTRCATQRRRNRP